MIARNIYALGLKISRCFILLVIMEMCIGLILRRIRSFRISIGKSVLCRNFSNRQQPSISIKMSPFHVKEHGSGF